MKRLLYTLLFIILLSQTPSLLSQSAVEYFDMGYKEFSAGNYPKAIEYFSASIESDPTSAVTFYNRGNTYAIGLKDYTAALSDYLKAIELKPDFAEAFCNSGLAFNGLNNFNSAITFFTNALSINADLFNAYSGRGYSYYNLKMYPEAISDFSNAISLNPDFNQPYYGRGKCYDILKEYTKSYGDFDKLISFGTDNPEVYMHRGVALSFGFNDYSNAILDFNKSIELDSLFYKSYFYRAYARTNLDDYEGAISDLTKSIEIKPNFSAGYRNRGLNYNIIGDIDKACKDWKKAESLGETDVKELISKYCK